MGQDHLSALRTDLGLEHAEERGQSRQRPAAQGGQVLGMSEYSFTLLIDGTLTEERVRALHQAGCDDMTFQGDESGRASADVHREAGNLVEAVRSAVTDIESVPGLAVLAVEDQELVGLADIAWRLDRTLESVRLLASGRRRSGFPSPAVRRVRGKLWRWSDVAEWANRHLGTSFDLDEADLITAINATLALRRIVTLLPERERTALRTLAAAG
jgi:hypothetical protein